NAAGASTPYVFFSTPQYDGERADVRKSTRKGQALFMTLFVTTARQRHRGWLSEGSPGHPPGTPMNGIHVHSREFLSQIARQMLQLARCRKRVLLLRTPLKSSVYRDGLTP